HCLFRTCQSPPRSRLFPYTTLFRSDGRTYTFHLRPGLRFSNGQPVTAEDVKWSLDRFGNPKIDATMSSVAGGYGTSKVIDNTTIDRKSTRPNSSHVAISSARRRL